MSDGNGSHKGLGTFLNQISALILAVISLFLAFMALLDCLPIEMLDSSH